MLEPIDLHPEIAPYFASISNLDPPMEQRDPREVRALMDGFALKDQPPRPADVVVEDLLAQFPDRNIKLRLYKPKGAAGPLPLMLYFHGGGFIMGNLDTHDRYVCMLTRSSGAAYLAVDYRLAPEHPFPAPQDDAFDALLWIYERAESFGIDRNCIGLSGDSGGAQLSAVCTFKARELGYPKLSLQLLIYPGGMSPDKNSPSYNRWSGLLLTPNYGRWFSTLYKPRPDDPYSYPILQKNLKGLPPAYVVTCEYDICRDEGEAYAMALMEAGVSTTLHRVPKVQHPFFRVMHLSPYVRAEMREMGRQIRRYLAPEPDAGC